MPWYGAIGHEFIACQEIIFGGLGQTLKLRQDTISRDSFMPGVIIAVKEIQNKLALIYGLDKLL